MAARIPQRTNKEVKRIQRALNFSLGKPVSKGIPWNKFSEMEIQGILKLHYEALGYNVVWRHKQDPANEGGIDLECYRKTDNKRVMVAVKLKPLKQDKAQVIELADSPADQRIYVYTNGAAQSFRDWIKKYESDIEFWDRKKLEANLNESDLTLKLKIDNSSAAYSIHEITKLLENRINSKQKKGCPEPTAEIVNRLWNMKDRAVSVNKCAGMVQFMFEDPKKLGKMNRTQVLNLVLWCLDYMAPSLDSLYDSFKLRSSILNALILYTHEETSGRSNWFNLKMYDPGLIPGNIESMVENSTFTHALNDGEILEGSTENKESDYDFLYFDRAAGEFRYIGIWASALEETIDSFQQVCIDKIFTK